MKLNEVKWPSVISNKTGKLKRMLDQHRIGRAKSTLELMGSIHILDIQTKYLSTLDIPEYPRMEFEYRTIIELYNNVDTQLLLQNGVFKNKLKKLINEQKSYIQKL